MTTSVKTCFKCEIEKPLDEYYRHSAMGDGHLNKCKQCAKADVAKHREKNIDRIREYDRNRGSRLTGEYRKAYRERFPVKTKAMAMVNNALRYGEIEKADACEDCGSTFAIHGHHDDYAKPLEVRWLCAACHHQWHAKHGEAKNGNLTNITEV